MMTKIQRWGNSLGVRIPKSVAQDAQVTEGSLVEMRVEDGRLVIAPVKKPECDLADLLSRVTSENLHGEADWGPRRGREAW